jgi:TolB-like protein/DNA-binding winged helix-turn-helix (wHTH) protein/Flp pilus assembly protein TadD
MGDGRFSAEAGIDAYVFEDFRLEVRRRRLLRDGRAVALPPKAVETLLVLIEHRDRVVEKEELMQRLWPDTVVEEANLSQHVFSIRKALGEKAGEHRFIATAARRGYQFVGGVREVSATQPEDAPATSARPPARRRLAAAAAALVLGLSAGAAMLWTWQARGAGTIRSVAVLPFQNVSGDVEQEFFADGLTDAITTDLASIRALRVVSRQSASRFKGSQDPLAAIGRQLDADALLLGTVARDGSRVRLTAQLVDARRDGHLWAGSYDRPAGDVLALQGELARAVAEAVNARLQEPERTELSARRPIDPEAYDLYLRGRRLFGQRNEQALQKSLEYYEAAIAREPAFAAAHGAIALTLVPHTMFYGRPDESLRKLRAAAERALALDARQLDAQLALATLRDMEFDWIEAERLHSRVIEQSPSNAQAHQWYGYLLAALGRFDEALALRQRAVALDPFSASYTTSLADTLAFMGRLDEAMARYRQTLELEPLFVRARVGVSAIHLARGEAARALDALELAARATGDDPVILGPLGHAYGVAARPAQAADVLDRLTSRAAARYVSPVFRAHVYAGLGQRDRAVTELEEAYRQRSPTLISAAVDPFLRPLHGDPRFTSLLRRMQLPAR